MFDLDLLRLFVGVAKLGSVARAARAERMSPSFASRRLTALEEALGVHLFVRGRSAARLTRAGEVCLTWASRNLDRHEELLGELSLLDGAARGIVRVASHAYTRDNALDDIIAEFRLAYPEVQLLVTFDDRPGRLIGEGYDIAIHAGPIPDGSFVGRKIRTYRRVVCASPDFLARNSAPLTPPDLEQLDVLNHSVSETATWYFRDENGSIISQPVRSVLECNSFAMLRDLALAGLGIIRIGESIVRAELAQGRLVHLLPGYRCIDAAYHDYALRLIFPDQHQPLRVRLFAQYLLDRWGSGAPGNAVRPKYYERSRAAGTHP